MSYRLQPGKRFTALRPTGRAATRRSRWQNIDGSRRCIERWSLPQLSSMSRCLVPARPASPGGRCRRLTLRGHVGRLFGVADLKKRSRRKLASRTCRSLMRSIASIARSRTGFLPYVEDGTDRLGAATENPSFLNPVRLPGARILRSRPERRRSSGWNGAEELVARQLPRTAAARDAGCQCRPGDGRFVLNQAETLFDVAQPPAPAAARGCLRQGPRGPRHSLHCLNTSGSDQAALHRQDAGRGEEPRTLRRLIRAAVEDIGLADRTGGQCVAAEGYDSSAPKASWADPASRPASTSPPRPTNAVYRGDGCRLALGRNRRGSPCCPRPFNDRPGDENKSSHETR